MVLTYNDPQELADAFAKHGDKIAAVIVEPVVGNMNLIAPTAEFLKAHARTVHEEWLGTDFSMR